MDFPFIHFQGFDWCICWNRSQIPGTSPGTRTPGSRMRPQPQLDRTLAVKSRWGGDEGPAHPNAAYLWQILCGDTAHVDGASIWEAHLSQPRHIYSFVTYTHTHTHTHTHTSHLSAFPQWAANSSLGEIQRPKTDSWLQARYYQFLIITSLGDGFFTWSPGWALRHKPLQVIHYIVCILQWLLSACFKNAKSHFLASCCANLIFTKWLYFPRMKQRMVGSCCHCPALRCGCQRVAV